MTLLHLRDIAERRDAEFSIVSEMLDDRNRQLAEVTQVDDVIVSDKVVSLMMAQISENKHLAQVFTQLFSASGSEIYLRPASEYVRPGAEANYATIVEAARRRGESAIGYRRGAQAHDAEADFGVVGQSAEVGPLRGRRRRQRHRARRGVSEPRGVSSGAVEAETTAVQGADEELAWAGPSAQAEAIRDESVSPTELVEMHLARIARLDPKLNTFRVVLAERALAEAKQAEARLKAGDERPLLGVPIALKDTADLAGELTTHGTDAFPDPVRADSEMVRRLRAAGAIIIGKTHLPEMAICGFTESATWGVTRNPWDLQRSPGGSSGGSAAAVAAGLVTAASASDGMGSIRIPAASCGVFGLKPTRGRIPVNPDWESWHGMSVNGFLTRGVADSAMLLDITAGGSTEPGAPPDPERSFAEAVSAPPQGLRIATTTKPLPLMDAAPVVDEAVPGALAETGRVLESLGHGVDEAAPNWGLLAPNMMTRFLRGVRDEVRDTPRPERLERRTRGFARMAAGLTDGLLRRAIE